METMPLTPAQRKERMPYGAQRKIARRRRVAPPLVSETLAGEAHPKTQHSKEKVRRIQSDIAKEIGVAIEVAFSPEELAVSALPGETLAGVAQ